MDPTVAVRVPSPRFAVEGFSLRTAWWIPVAFLIGAAVTIPAHLAVQAAARALGASLGPSASWWTLFGGHILQALVAIAVIGVLKRWFIPADYGLHLPRGRWYVWPALAWGALFGVLMTVVDHGAEIFRGLPPDGEYQLTTDNVAKWLTFEATVVGLSEEIVFRALLVTFLMHKMPGQLRAGRYTISVAGVALAAVFALAHITSFWQRPFWPALGQQVYAFALGVLYAYWFERSKSVVASSIGHNVSNTVEYLLLFGAVALFGP